MNCFIADSVQLSREKQTIQVFILSCENNINQEIPRKLLGDFGEKKKLFINALYFFFNFSIG